MALGLGVGVLCAGLPLAAAVRVRRAARGALLVNGYARKIRLQRAE